MAIRYKASPDGLFIGRQGENLAREIEFNINDWIDTFGEGSVFALYRRKDDEAPYPLNPTVADGKAVWTITNVDTAYTGSGECELRYVVDDVIVKSMTYKTFVSPSLKGEMNPPEALPDWVADVLAAGEAARKPLDKFKLIESILLTSATTEIVRKQTADGKPYSFKAVMIELGTSTAGKNGDITVFAKNDENGKTLFTEIVKNAVIEGLAIRTKCFAVKFGGIYFSVSTEGSRNNYRSVNSGVYSVSIPDEPIGYLQFTGNIPNGTVIKIYAIEE